MKKATFFHAGSPVRGEAGGQLATALDPRRYQAEVAHPGGKTARALTRRRVSVLGQRRPWW